MEIESSLNPWARKSYQIARSKDYLLKLSQIYPADLPPPRSLDQASREKILELHGLKKGEELVKFLIELKKRDYPFPFEHPYASLLSESLEALEANPGMVEKLGKILLSMDPEEIIRGCTRPPDLNRMMGPAFQDWIVRTLPQYGYPALPKHKFDLALGNALFLGRDAAIKRYVLEKFRIELGEVGKDLLVKFLDSQGQTRFLIGEARFLTTHGGSQTRDLKQIIQFLKQPQPPLIKVAILDGIMWFHRDYLKLVSQLEEHEYVISALLLKDFLESLR